nr:cell division cycle 5-like protein [Quercus suber]
MKMEQWNRPSSPATVEELEGKRRMDVEAQLRKQNIAKNKISERQDAPSAILQANKMNDPETVRKRTKLMLPAPHISDHELEEIAKIGVTPKKREILTPNPMLTPSATPGGAGLAPRIGMTPSRDVYSFNMTPMGTPISDELHINEDMDIHDSARLDQRRQADLRRNLHSGLSTLPRPKNDYQIVMQLVPEENEEPEEKIEDMSDRMARENAEKEARQQALLRKILKVLQWELPRPPTASLGLIRNSLIRADGENSSFVPPTSIEQADEMIRKELLTLLELDNEKYSLKKKMNKEKKRGVKRSVNGSVVPEIDDFEEEELEEV